MYLMGTDEYECDICGFVGKWDAHEEQRGGLWKCESCGKDFCTSCFANRHGRKAFDYMLWNSDVVVCPDCFDNDKFYLKRDFEATLTQELRGK